MFAQLFAENGLTLDRLRALLEVGAAGSIAKAAQNDAVRQSQYSRQIKELEDFFRTRLIERHGKGTRLTPSGKELARISRFFLLGLSNFQRGCLREEQTFRIGAGATFSRILLIPALSSAACKARVTYVSETISDDEIERRLHDLTLDFGVVVRPELSRPLQTRELLSARLELWIPKALKLGPDKAARAFAHGALPLALAVPELEHFGFSEETGNEYHLICGSFMDARAAIEGRKLGALLPDFLAPGDASKAFLRVPVPKLDACVIRFHLAWNPRLLRLNPHAVRQRDWLANVLTRTALPPDAWTSSEKACRSG